MWLSSSILHMRTRVPVCTSGYIECVPALGARHLMMVIGAVRRLSGFHDLEALLTVALDAKS